MVVHRSVVGRTSVLSEEDHGALAARENPREFESRREGVHVGGGHGPARPRR